MRIKSLWSIALMALVTLGCAKEAGENATGETQTNCINVSLKMSNPATKADPVFENGSELESKTDRVVFAFFNAQGVCVATSNWDSPTFTTNATGNSIEQYKTDKVTFELPVGAKLPVSMMVYVNPINTEDLNMTLAEAKSKKRTSYVGTTTNYGFAMNNAVYFDASGKKMIEVETPADAYFSAESTGTGIDAIPVCVERMAVKVSLEYKENYTNDGIELNNAANKIKFVPDNWGITCTEKEMYLIKRFNDSYTPEFVNASPTNVFTGWNDIANHRSYWANSVSYGLDKNVYPDVSDDLIVTPEPFFQQNFTGFDKTSYPIAYLSYKQIKATPDNSLYCNENTIRNFVPSAATSVIIKGHYVYAEGANVGANVGTFYVRGTDFYTEKTLKNFFINRIKNYLRKSDGGEITISSDSDPVYDDFELVHPTQSLNTGSKNTERLVTLNLKASAKDNYKTIETEGAEAQAITDLAAVNNRIYNIASVAEAFKDGKAVFFWALRHLNPTEGGIGHYGAVRNHWYKVTVNSITNLGTGIFDEDAPLIPHDDETNFGINATVNILAWRLVTNEANL